MTDKLCRDNVIAALEKYGLSTCSVRMDSGTTDLHRKLEKKVADFVGKEDAVVFAMGFATNSTVIPVLAGSGGLLISDSLNHSSIVTGCRSSKAKINTFKHNDVQDLERVIRTSIIEGQPGTGR